MTKVLLIIESSRNFSGTTVSVATRAGAVRRIQNIVDSLYQSHIKILQMLEDRKVEA